MTSNGNHGHDYGGDSLGDYSDCGAGDNGSGEEDGDDGGDDNDNDKDNDHWRR